jgi:hypothetical protein
MTDRNQEQQSENQPQQAETPATPKKTFVEPTISSPVDVLEATTFFQVVDSGGTGLKRKDTD